MLETKGLSLMSQESAMGTTSEEVQLTFLDSVFP
jgi:hypothetical protein